MSEARERERGRKKGKFTHSGVHELHLGSYLFCLSPGRREKKKKKIIMVKSKLDENNDDDKRGVACSGDYTLLSCIFFSPGFFVSFSVVFLSWRKEMMGKLAMAIGASFFFTLLL
jgi:hypothetical protein